MDRVFAGLRHLPNWWQLGRFLTVGASGFAINIVLYALLVHPLRGAVRRGRRDLERRRAGVELRPEPPVDVRGDARAPPSAGPALRGRERRWLRREPADPADLCRGARAPEAARRDRRERRRRPGELPRLAPVGLPAPAERCHRRVPPRMPKSALITGITGQDGSYLAELLLEKGYDVHGMVRRASTEKFERIEHIRDRITLHQGDLLDQRSLVDTLRASRPDEIYNLAAMSLRGGVVGPADADGGVHRRRRHADPRGDARGLPGGALLPGVELGDVRQGARGPADRGRRRSTRARPTAWRRPTGTSSRSTTASPTTCTRRAGSFSTTSRRAAGSSSSPARSPGTPPRSSTACATSSRSATSTPSATGATPRTTSWRCG